MNRKKYFWRWGVLALIIIICYTMYIAIDIWAYARVDETLRADAAIVLGAQVIDNMPSPVFEERILHSIWLYENGYVDKLIFTGGKSDGNSYSEGYTAKQYAINRGVPEEDILIEEISKTTQENIYNLIDIVDLNNAFLLVSDPLHMKRAMLIAYDAGLTAYSSPTSTTKYQTFSTKIPFWAREMFFYIGYRIYRLF